MRVEEYDVFEGFMVERSRTKVSLLQFMDETIFLYTILN